MAAYVSAIIVAAGGSVRMGIADSKQFIPLLSRPAIEYTLKAFQKCYLIKEIIVVCREQDTERIQAIVDENGFAKVSKLVLGGSSRAESVRNGVEAANEKDFIGGVKVFNPTRRVSVDYSFKELLAEEKKEFLQNSGLTID